MRYLSQHYPAILLLACYAEFSGSFFPEGHPATIRQHHLLSLAFPYHHYLHRPTSLDPCKTAVATWFKHLVPRTVPKRHIRADVYRQPFLPPCQLCQACCEDSRTARALLCYLWFPYCRLRHCLYPSPKYRPSGLGLPPLSTLSSSCQLRIVF